MSGVGMCPGNVNIVKSIGALTKGGTEAVVMPGDYNVTPQELQKAGILDALHLTIVAPDTKTCNTENGRIIDYVLVTKQFASLIKKVELVTLVPWSPHYGLRIWLLASPYMVMYTDMWRPMKLQEAVKWASKNGHMQDDPILLTVSEA